MHARWYEPSSPEEQETLAESGGWVIARRGVRGPVRYVERVYPEQSEAEAARVDLLSVYPDDSPWWSEIFVSRV